MIDTRAVAQEVQDQLAAAVQRSHEQFRKGQEQIRKGRESVTAAVRTGGQIAQAVRPNLPKLQLRFPPLSELASPEKLLATQRKLTDQAIASQRKLAGHAQDFADQAVATQRKLGSKAIEVASPLIADGMAKLTQVAGTFAAGRRTERTEPLDHAAVATDPAAKIEQAPAAKAGKPAGRPRATKAAGTTKATGTAKATGTTKAAGTTKANPARSTTAKSSAAKSGTTKSGTAGTAKAKSSAASKPRTAKK
jgi:hypothetical protein